MDYISKLPGVKTEEIYLFQRIITSFNVNVDNENLDNQVEDDLLNNFRKITYA